MSKYDERFFLVLEVLGVDAERAIRAIHRGGNAAGKKPIKIIFPQPKEMFFRGLPVAFGPVENPTVEFEP